MKKWAKALVTVGAALLVAVQLVQPRRPTPGPSQHGAIYEHIPVPADVKAILRAACYDCHSNETRWPWYARISPVSWMVVGDVRHGRSNLDFSDWSPRPQVEPTPVQRLTWSCREARDEVMPPLAYRLLHPEARLDEDAKETLCGWTEAAVTFLEGESPDVP